MDRRRVLTNQAGRIARRLTDKTVSASRGPTEHRSQPAVDRYLELMRGCLTRSVFADMEPGYDGALREEGRDWPATAETMIGLRRLKNVEEAVRTVVVEGIEGDLIETGVWRGGSCIMMKAVLAAYGDTTRRVFVADSFRGLPPPDPKRSPPELVEEDLSIHEQLAVSAEDVRANFRRYGLLDERVVFVEGWFKDTLPELAVKRLAVLRLDGDYYESTMDALSALYPKLQRGGFCIVDDYGCFETCRRAVHDYLDRHSHDVNIIPIDWTGVYWRVP